MYAFPAEVPHGDLDTKKSFLPGDIGASGLSKEGFPDPMSFYY